MRRADHEKTPDFDSGSWPVRTENLWTVLLELTFSKALSLAQQIAQLDDTIPTQGSLEFFLL
jgi:hypothetical protein